MRWSWLVVIVAWAATVAAADTQDPTQSAPQAVSGDQMGQLRDYGRTLGEGWLKDTFGLDLPSIAAAWDPDSWTVARASDLGTGFLQDSGQAAGTSPTASPGPASGVSMRVTQSDNLGRLSQGLHDVPFGVELKGTFRVLDTAPVVRASLNIPLSPYDTWRAEARVPVDLSSTADAWWWRGLGLGKDLSLRSNLSSRLGFNEVEAGMGTDWTPGFWGVWDLDYAWHASYGQGSGASSNWLKVSKHF